MTCAEIMDQLKSKSNAKMRDIYVKHGGGENHFGVVLSDLRDLAKQIKTNHELGLELWATGNQDARLLGSLIIKPKSLSIDDLRRMMSEIDFTKLADWFGKNVVLKTAHADTLRDEWRDSDHMCSARIGWWLCSRSIESGTLDHDELLALVEAQMADAPPAKQEAMNWCLVEIGVKDASRRARALEIGERLGVYRDYPVAKGCISPFAPTWINWALSQP